MRILFIEDNLETSQMLKDYLVVENFEVICAIDRETAQSEFNSGQYNIVLLDLMIPKISGMDVMKYIRRINTVPIIIISAKDTDSDKTLGLGLGADDYVTKPFSVTEVLARIKANIQRNTEYAMSLAEPGQLTAEALIMDLLPTQLRKMELTLT